MGERQYLEFDGGSVALVEHELIVRWGSIERLDEERVPIRGACAATVRPERGVWGGTSLIISGIEPAIVLTDCRPDGAAEEFAQTVERTRYGPR